jgi:hypothetical protein
MHILYRFGVQVAVKGIIASTEKNIAETVVFLLESTAAAALKPSMNLKYLVVSLAEVG